MLSMTLNTMQQIFYEFLFSWNYCYFDLEKVQSDSPQIRGEHDNSRSYIKADFQSVLRSLSGLMLVRLTDIRGKSMLFVTNCLPYLQGAFKFFLQ